MAKLLAQHGRSEAVTSEVSQAGFFLHHGRLPLKNILLEIGKEQR
ncbi:hypothetical protein [Pseudomonas aeruginosa]|nr:hypothetical protein [Pseudomonas aeruginosa]